MAIVGRYKALLNLRQSKDIYGDDAPLRTSRSWGKWVCAILEARKTSRIWIHTSAIVELRFNIDELVQGWNDMYESKRWERGIPSFDLVSLLRQRVFKLYHAFEILTEKSWSVGKRKKTTVGSSFTEPRGRGAQSRSLNSMTNSMTKDNFSSSSFSVP